MIFGKTLHLCRTGRIPDPPVSFPVWDGNANEYLATVRYFVEGESLVREETLPSSAPLSSTVVERLDSFSVSLQDNNVLEFRLSFRVPVCSKLDHTIVVIRE